MSLQDTLCLAALIAAIICMWVTWPHWGPAAARVAKEPFATRAAKAAKAHELFSQHPTPSYSEYRRHMGGKSNIVEYEDIMGLIHNQNFTLPRVEQVMM